MLLIAGAGDDIAVLVVVPLFLIAGAVLSGWGARRKGRSVVGWALLGAVFGLWALAVVALLPAKTATTFRYGLQTADGDELGAATYERMIGPGEEILSGDGRRYTVLNVLPEGKEEPSLVGTLEVEAAVVARSPVGSTL